MALTLQQKKQIVSEVSDVAKNAISAVGAEYRGMTVEQMTAMRVAARKADVAVRVVPNNLAKRAIEGTEFECIKDSLKGPLFLAFSRREPSAAARVVSNIAKENDKLLVKFLALDGKLLGAKDLNAVASLPTFDEGVAKLLSVMQAPVTKLVRTVVAPVEKLVRTLAAVRDSK